MDTSINLPSILQPTENDIALMLAAKCHLGSQNVNSKMRPYIFSRRPDGIHIIHIGKAWEKLILAARVIATVEPSDIYVTFSAAKTRRSAIKLAKYLGGKNNQSRFVPGTFTNTLEEPSLLISMDPLSDYQAMRESSFCNIPVIAFTNLHCPLHYVDLAIPSNNRGSQSLGVMCWLLARAVLRLRGVLDYQTPWNVMPDMFFDSDEVSVEDENTEYPTYAAPYFNDYNQDQPVGGVNWGDNDIDTTFVDTRWGGDQPAKSTIGVTFSDQGFTSSWSQQAFEGVMSITSTSPSMAPLNSWADDIPEAQEPPKIWNETKKQEEKHEEEHEEKHKEKEEEREEEGGWGDVALSPGKSQFSASDMGWGA